MNLYEVFEKYGTHGGEDLMWETLEAVSDYVEEVKSSDMPRFKRLMKELCGIMHGKHFNEELADEQIEQMFYVDGRGVRHKAPYWTKEQMSQAYHAVKGAIPSVHTEHDFWVALSMMKSDYGNLLESWFPNEADNKVIEMTVSWFNDPDAKNGDTKTWNYFM